MSAPRYEYKFIGRGFAKIPHGSRCRMLSPKAGTAVAIETIDGVRVVTSCSRIRRLSDHELAADLCREHGHVEPRQERGRPYCVRCGETIAPSAVKQFCVECGAAVHIQFMDHHLGSELCRKRRAGGRFAAETSRKLLEKLDCTHARAVYRKGERRCAKCNALLDGTFL
jgi:hypothetical protein